MSTVYSSVATSRLNSSLLKATGAALSTSSGQSRVSMQEAINAAARKLDRGSVSTSIQSRLSLSTKLCQFLEEHLMVDEYGFTDKTCRKCSNRLSLEEILALCVPLGGEIDLEKLRIEDGVLICLSCYAE